MSKSEKEKERPLPDSAAVSFLTDTLIGVLRGSSDPKAAKAESLKEKYGSAD